MAINNTVELIGNMGAEARIIETDGSNFAAFTLYTTDSYKDEESGEYKNKESIRHEVIVFNPTIIEIVKGFSTKARIKIIGSLTYREFKIMDNGKEITKREASIVAKRIDQAPLVKKTKDSDSKPE